MTVYGDHQWRIAFSDHECTCDHDSSVHDDGFGCTEPECPCLAGFHIETEE